MKKIILKTCLCLLSALFVFSGCQPDKNRFFEAVQNGDTNAIMTYIKSGGNINIKNKQGNTALMEAARNPHTEEVVKFLIGMKADINAANKSGQTALLIATKCNFKSLKILVQSKADVNARDGYGNTALIIAAQDENASALNLLIDAGAHVSARNYIGNSALTHIDSALARRSHEYDDGDADYDYQNNRSIERPQSEKEQELQQQERDYNETLSFQAIKEKLLFMEKSEYYINQTPAVKGIENITTSSVTPPAYGHNFLPQNLVDENLSSTWQTGNNQGIGEWIEFQFDRDFTRKFIIRAIGIANGYQFVNQNFGELYYLNNRIKTASVYVYDEQTGQWKTRGKIQFTDEPKLSIFSGYNFYKVTRIRIVIEEVYEGSRWKDLAVSEAVFYGEAY